MNITNFFLSADKSLFQTINSVAGFLPLDLFFAFLSGIGRWGIVWLVLSIAFLIIEEKKKNFRVIITLIFAIFLSIILVEFTIKPLIHRSRPEFSMADVQVLFDESSSPSFPSTHATVAFAGATILSFFHKRYRVTFFLLAFLIALSRIYLGKHYPSDIIAGGLLGTAISLTIIQLESIAYRIK